MSDLQIAYPLILNKVASPHYVTPTLRRERLLEWLQQAARCRATVLAADAGYGKTTLLWQWEREVDFPCYWYKLDRTDRDWTLHVSYLIEAVRQRHVGFGRRAHSSLQQLAGQGSSRAGVAAYLLAEMHEQLIEPCTFIIDDWQYVNAAIEVRGLWNQILRDAPPTCRFVFASRAKPRLQFARFKTHGGYAELGTAALRFTESEIDELFRDIYKDPLELEELSELEHRTEGWAASLQLIGVSLQEKGTQEERRAFIAAATAANDSNLFDYLAEEVLDQQPEETRNFLLSTSIVQQVTPMLAERLAGVYDGRRALLDLEQRGLFTYRLDNERYRYHHLFREFLQRRLALDKSDAELIGLHIHAATHLEAAAEWPDAIDQYLRAGLQRQAARLVAHHGEELAGEGRLGLVDGWLLQLPDRTVRENARLSLLQGEVALFRSQWTDSHLALERARAYFSRKGDRRMEALASLKLSSLESYLGNVEEAATHAERGLALVPADDLVTTLRLVGNLAVTRLWASGNLSEVISACRRIAVEATALGHDHTAAIAFNNLGIALRDAGLFAESEASLERAGSMWAGRYPCPFADNYDLVVTLLMRDGVARAEQVCALALERTRPWSRAYAEAQASRAAIHAYRGEWDPALEILSRVHAHPNDLGAANQVIGSLLIDCMFLAGMDHRAMNDALGRVRAGPPDDRISYLTDVASALVTHAAPGCAGECLSGQDVPQRLRAQGATAMAALVDLKCSTLRADHDAAGSRDTVCEAINEVLRLGLARYSRWWLRRLAAHLPVFRASSAADSIGSLLALDPEQWRVPAIAALSFVRGSSRAALLATIMRTANREVLQLLASVRGDDVKEARRVMSRQQAPRLFVRTFGALRVHRGSWVGPSIPLDKKRVRMLLAVLCAHVDRSLSRDEAIELLWPDSDAASAGNSLNQSVFQLRRALDSPSRDADRPQYLLNTLDNIHFDRQLVKTDLEEFRRLASQGANPADRHVLLAMMDLIQGEYLADAKYEDWALRIQPSVHAEVRLTLLPIAERRDPMTSPDLAVSAANALIQLDAFDERAQVALALALAGSGRRVAARERLTAFRLRFREEFQEDPSTEVLEAQASLVSSIQG